MDKTSVNINDFAPSHNLYLRVRAGFVAQGLTLGGWCRERSINPTNARSALLGAWNGPAGRKLRDELLVASGVVHRSQLSA